MLTHAGGNTRMQSCLCVCVPCGAWLAVGICREVCFGCCCCCCCWAALPAEAALGAGSSCFLWGIGQSVGSCCCQWCSRFVALKQTLGALQGTPAPHGDGACLECACRKRFSSHARCDHGWWRYRRSALVALQAEDGLEQAAHVHHGRRDGQAQQHRQQQAQDGGLAVAHGPAHPVRQGVQAAVTVRHLAHNYLPPHTSNGCLPRGCRFLIFESFTSRLSQ